MLQCRRCSSSNSLVSANWLPFLSLFLLLLLLLLLADVVVAAVVVVAVVGERRVKRQIFCDGKIIGIRNKTKTAKQNKNKCLIKGGGKRREPLIISS